MEKSLVSHYYQEFELIIIPKISDRELFPQANSAFVYGMQLFERLGLEQNSKTQNNFILDKIVQVAVTLSLNEQKIWQNSFDKTFTNNITNAISQN